MSAFNLLAHLAFLSARPLPCGDSARFFLLCHSVETSLPAIALTIWNVFFFRRFFSICFYFDPKRRSSCCCPLLELFDCIQQNVCMVLLPVLRFDNRSRCPPGYKPNEQKSRSTRPADWKKGESDIYRETMASRKGVYLYHKMTPPPNFFGPRRENLKAWH